MCCLFWFVAACVFAGVFGWAYQKQFNEYDVSGMVICDVVTNVCKFDGPMYSWMQHPGEPEVLKIEHVSDQYDGMNFFLFESGKTPVSGKILIDADGKSFTVAESLAMFTRESDERTTVPIFATLDP